MWQSYFGIYNAALCPYQLIRAVVVVGKEVDDSCAREIMQEKGWSSFGVVILEERFLGRNTWAV